MNKKLKIGIVGCGAIGSTLARAISFDFINKVKLTGLYDIDKDKSYRLAEELNDQKLVSSNLDNLIKTSKLVIEATSQKDAFSIAKKSISASRDILIMSVGGIIHNYQELEKLAKKKKARIFIPSGAICGIDGLKAAAQSKINKVILTTRKPPRAFLNVPYIVKKRINLDTIKKDTVIFEGDAISAIKAFPQNINVAATLSIAGIGHSNTIVRIIASPKIRRNIHQIEVESDSGRISVITENVVHPHNPKTSYLAVLSALAVIRGILGNIRVGT